jgi:hypothetical protein
MLVPSLIMVQAVVGVMIVELEGIMDFMVDGSETSWLVYADWLEDQGLDARHIREPLFVNEWFLAYIDVMGGGFVAGYYNYVGALREGSFDNDVGAWSFEYSFSTFPGYFTGVGGIHAR